MFTLFIMKAHGIFKKISILPSCSLVSFALLVSCQGWLFSLCLHFAVKINLVLFLVAFYGGWQTAFRSIPTTVWCEAQNGLLHSILLTLPQCFYGVMGCKYSSL